LLRFVLSLAITTIMIFTSHHSTLCLPPEEDSNLPHFLLDVPASARTAAELLFPPPRGSPFSSNRPSSSPLSLDAVRRKAYQTAKCIIQGAMDGKSTAFKKGDVVAIYSPNQHDYTAVLLGIHLAGGVTALCNPSYKSTELAHQLRMTKAKCIITSAAAQGGREGDSPVEKARAAISLACSEDDDHASGGFKRLEEEPALFLFEEDHDESWQAHCNKVKVDDEVEKEVKKRSQQIQGGDAAVFCFSSGTSGLPKAVTLTHHNLISNVIQATFTLHDRMNEPLVGGQAYSKDGKTGWYDEGEERGAGKDIKPWEEEDMIAESEGNDTRHDEKGPSLINTLFGWREGKSDSKGQRSKGFERIASRPEGQKEFHIDVLPQFHCYGLLISLISLHTVSQGIHERILADVG
jgi:4-coumarate--CoA ligase